MDKGTTYTLITGGSLGIGKALARECAGRGMILIFRIIPQGLRDRGVARIISSEILT